MSNQVTKCDLASRLVNRDVVACASQLVSALYEATKFPLDNLRLEEDDIRDLVESKNYESACLTYLSTADLNDLEAAVEACDGDWDEFLVEHGFPTNDMLEEAVDALWDKLVELEDIEEPTPEQEAELATLRTEYDSLPGDLDDWLHANEGQLDKLRANVEGLCDQLVDWEKLADIFGIEPDYDEVYEHWIVSDFLGRKLEEQGETVRTVLGLTIWGRCCTGQAIALDYVIQRIAVDLWGEELTATDCADAF